MKTLTINMTDTEFENYGFQNTNLNFSDFLKLINKEIFINKLDHSILLAEKYGLSELSIEDINQEIMEVRNSAKNYN